jgi:hypothetical protein
MRRLECIASLLLVFGAPPIFPATVSIQIGDAGREYSAGSFPNTSTFPGFQAFGIVGMLQDVRLEEGLGGSATGILAFNNTNEYQTVRAGESVFVSIPGVGTFFYSADVAEVELGPGESGSSGNSGSDYRFGGVFPRGPFLGAEVELIRDWNTDIINPAGIPIDVSFDYGFNGTLYYDFVPGPEPAQFFPVALGLFGLVMLWRARSKFSADLRPR